MFPEVHEVSLNCSNRSLPVSLKPVTPPCWFVACTTLPPLFLILELNCFVFCLPLSLSPSHYPCIRLQGWQSGHLGSTSTTLEGTGTTNAWKRSDSITGRGSVHGPRPWRLGPQTGWQPQTLGKWCIPAWRKVSGASTRSNATDACAPTTTSAFSVPQVAVQREYKHSSLQLFVTFNHFLLIWRMTFYPCVCIQHKATGQSGVNGVSVQQQCVTTLASRSATGNV